MRNTWHIRGGRIVDPSSDRDEIGDLYIKDGLIAPLPNRTDETAGVIDAAGLIVMPGLIDLHVHFREPGGEEAETVATGSAAAARGGFTTVVTMPNTRPPVDSPAAVREAVRSGRRTGKVRLRPAACLTRGRQGVVVADMEAMAAAGAVAFTDDGSAVDRDEVMEQAMRRARVLNRLVMDHALDARLAAGGVMHAGRSSERLGLPGISAEAEVHMVKRDLALCERTGCPIHIQHVSCGATVALLRSAQARGLPASGEATPHHLALTDADIVEADPNFKMSPPLRTEADRQAVLEGVLDGTLQALATDHAPHAAAQKARGFLEAPFGIVGLETAVGVTYPLLTGPGRMSLREWAARWTIGPARLLGFPVPGLNPGQPADVAILDLASEWTVNPDDFLSRSRNSPFIGRTLKGRAVYTLLDGMPTWWTGPGGSGEH